jgi:hypothetical protein
MYASKATLSDLKSLEQITLKLIDNSQLFQENDDRADTYRTHQSIQY